MRSDPSISYPVTEELSAYRASWPIYTLPCDWRTFPLLCGLTHPDPTLWLKNFPSTMRSDPTIPYPVTEELPPIPCLKSLLFSSKIFKYPEECFSFPVFWPIHTLLCDWRIFPLPCVSSACCVLMNSSNTPRNASPFQSSDPSIPYPMTEELSPCPVSQELAVSSWTLQTSLLPEAPNPIPTWWLKELNSHCILIAVSMVSMAGLQMGRVSSFSEMGSSWKKKQNNRQVWIITILLECCAAHMKSYSHTYLNTFAFICIHFTWLFKIFFILLWINYCIFRSKSYLSVGYSLILWLSYVIFSF